MFGYPLFPAISQYNALNIIVSGDLLPFQLWFLKICILSAPTRAIIPEETLCGEKRRRSSYVRRERARALRQRMRRKKGRGEAQEYDVGCFLDHSILTRGFTKLGRFLV